MVKRILNFILSEMGSPLIRKVSGSDFCTEELFSELFLHPSFNWHSSLAFSTALDPEEWQVKDKVGHFKKHVVWYGNHYAIG